MLFPKQIRSTTQGNLTRRYRYGVDDRPVLASVSTTASWSSSSRHDLGSLRPSQSGRLSSPSIERFALLVKIIVALVNAHNPRP